MNLETASMSERAWMSSRDPRAMIRMCWNSRSGSPTTWGQRLGIGPDCRRLIMLAVARECVSRLEARPLPWRRVGADIYRVPDLVANPLAALFDPDDCAQLLDAATWDVLDSTVSRAVQMLDGEAGVLADVMRDIVPWPLPSQPAPATPEIARLVTGALAEGLSGLAVLSDALEEAGCTDTGLLSHLRGPGPHTADCWALRRVQAAAVGA